ncbi:MAG TPA: hypothetical protein VHT92_00960 [Candidatus Cybelea sp.]|jgi:hypothetical protein|nr:hypothetical protein [Candidatus Cybelea sp.]
MSQEARQELVNLLVFQSPVEKGDLLDPNRTQTQLIALLLDLAKGKGWHIEITAVRTDHHDDSALGLHCHANGYAADCWPLASATPGNYLDAGDPRFASFLRDAAASSWLYQIGLAGSAYTAANMAAAGSNAFQDDGADHVHLGANGP